MIYLAKFFLELIMFQTYCTENQNILCFITFLPENCAIYEIIWKNIAERGRPQMTVWRMRIACWITKATNTHSKCVTLIVFPR